jgi:hypothetical protein
MSYKIIISTEPQIEVRCIIRDVDMSFIPMVEANPDYRAYLAWLDEGNTPEEWQPES